MARKVDVDIGVKNKMAAGLKSAKAAMMRFGKSAGRILKGVAVATVALGTAIVALGVKSLKSFAVQEAAERSLVEAMKAHGDAVDELLPKHKALASAIQDETGAADESTLALMAKLRTLGVTNDEMEKAVKLTMALSKVGMREKTAFRAAADAINGNTTALTTYIPELRQAKTDTEKMAVVNDLATRGYKQLSGELDTNAGRWREMKGRIGDVLERIGGAISGGESLKDTIASLSAKIKTFGDSPQFDAFLERVSGATASVIDFLKVMATGGGDAKKAFVALGDVIMLSIVSGAQQAANILHRGLAAAWDTFNAKAMDGFKTYGKMLINPVFAVKKYAEFAGKASSGGKDAVKDLFDVDLTTKRKQAAIGRLSESVSKGNDIGAFGSFAASVAAGNLKYSAGPNGNTASPAVAGQALGGVSATTSLLSTGDLFTMMQNGGIAKKETELAELQGINQGIQELIKVSGGVE